ncbi:MAG: hypothetical protein VB860_01215 [Dehalococcoidia bacterium]
MHSYEYWAEVKIKLPIHFLVDNGKSFIVKLSDYECRLTLQESSTPFLRGPGFGEMSGVEMRHDRRGLTRASDVQIHLPGPLLEVEADDMRSEGIEGSDPSANVLDQALTVINKFVDSYRFLSDEFHVRRILTSDLTGMWSVQIDWFKDGRYVVSSASGNFRSGMTLARNPAPIKFQNELAQWLNNTETPLHGLLLLNAKDYVEYGDYRMAVVDPRTSLEMMVDEILNQNFSATPIDAVRDILNVRPSASPSNLHEVIGAARINDKLKDGLRKAAGVSLADHTDLWSRWLASKQVREGAVHYGKAVSKRQAEDHIDVVQEMRELLSVDGPSDNWKVTYVRSGTLTTDWFSP